MNYVYILYSQKDKQLYVGYTDNLKNRLQKHNSKKVLSTSQRTPLVLIHYEVFTNKYDAYLREKWLKTGWGRNYLKKTLANTLKSLGG